jgi:hypothetical protein
MLKNDFLISLARPLLIALASLSLAACGLGTAGNSAPGLAADNAAGDNVVLAGSVGDGPVTGATIEVWSAQGKLLKTLTSDNTASFSSSLRVKGSFYPLLLKVKGGTDLVTGSAPDFQLMSVVTGRNLKQVNINPYSTLIVRLAQNLPGGLNPTTVITATAVVTGQLGYGLDPALMADPIGTTITDSNIANLVKSSETMGEMVRRTRDRIAQTGRKVNGDAVLAALAADLQDEKLDGVGAKETDPQITLVAKIVTGQVLVESLSNTLKVHGIIATLVLDQAIVTTRPLIGVEGLTGGVRATEGMLQQTLQALMVAGKLDSSVEVAALEQSVRAIAAGSLPAEIETVLPADASRALDNALSLALTANDSQTAALDAVVPDTTTTAPVTEPVVTDTTTTTTTTTEPVVTDTTTTTTTTTEPVVTDTTTTTTTTTEPVVTDTTTPVTEPVAPVNHAPTISGTPAGSVDAGSGYSFQPVASDADGDALRFSISGRPTWAAFNTGTGLLSGTPGDSAVGSYNNIVVSVTDGTDTVALPAFTISVNAVTVADPVPTSGDLALSWSAPATRTDGTPIALSEIGGYRIRYGSAHGSYTNTVTLNDGSLQSTTLNNIPAGTWYLVMTTLDTRGLESASSPEVVKTVN